MLTNRKKVETEAMPVSASQFVSEMMYYENNYKENCYHDWQCIPLFGTTVTVMISE